ncbi:TerD family protein [Desulfotomaculum sp. 1211_IL3151]|uniref:TerD family protein n=1 Tax=Desulfotomaculum sp. 1211_IL3151 TaxID=3084055 RepID=UPI002FDB6251
MSLTVMKGQKTDLTKRYPGLSQAVIGMGWQTNQTGIEIDGAAFMLQQDGKCRSDEDFIFYGNPKGRGGAVSVENTNTPDKAQLVVNLRQVPTDVQKIAFTLTIYEGPKRGHSFGQVPQVYIRLMNQGKEEILRFNVEQGFHSETAIVVAEIYRHNGEWKFNPIAMGYQGGLAALCGGFGIAVSDQPANQAQKESAPTIDLPKPPAEQPKQKLNLSKIELKKKGDKISLEKKANNQLGEILINLNWNQKSGKPTGLLGSIFGGRSSGVDLDLGCLIEMRNGDKGVIQALGKSFGNYHGFPYISLDGDDRTGAASAGENLRINGDHIPEFKRILVFAFIYDGVANWAEADGIVTIKQPGGPDIVVRMDEHDNRKIMCAIALIENVKNETFSIERIVRYFSGHSEMDKAFKWGLRWKAGSKD